MRIQDSGEALVHGGVSDTPGPKHNGAANMSNGSL